MQSPRTLALPLLLPLFGAAPLAQVVVVDDDGGPGVDFTAIQPAVNAAPAGATLLVHEGAYGGFQIQGKSLEVVADKDEVVLVQGTVFVRDLVAGQAVLLHGLTVQGPTDGPALATVSCDGPVWVEDGVFVAAQGQALTPLAGASVESCDAVSIHRTRLVGSRGVNADAGAGLRAVDSHVFLFEGSLQGGEATQGGFTPATAPGAGAHASGGLLLVNGGDMRGGSGADGLSSFLPCVDGTDGAPGLRLDGAAPAAELVGLVPQGGAGGQTLFPCVPGGAGPSYDVPSGSVTANPTQARELSIAGPLRPGEPLVLLGQGLPFEEVFYLIGFEQTPVLFGSPALLGGVLLPPFLPEVDFLGSTDANGSIVVQTTAPAPPTEALTIYTQGAFFDLSFTTPAVLSPAQSLTFLAPGF
ncbi:MAG: hypothetical protein AAF682_11635 [Planctomycetota bacterium]